MTPLLVLAPNPSSAASTRFRLEQFFPALRAAGIEPLLRPFLDENAFQLLYRRDATLRKAALALEALAGRVADLMRSTRARAVLIHREAALVGPPLIEWLLARVVRRPIVFDLDDAVWVPYASPTYGALLSRLLKAPGKTHFTLAAAARVIAGNAYIADYARRYNSRIDVIPTVVDTDAFHPAPRLPYDVPVLGWVGTHSSLQYLRAIVPALQKLAARRRFLLRVVGAELEAPGVTVENVRWSLEREVADFQSLDVGLYPLVEDAWSVGKSGFKAVQYMACGVPVVASPVGVTTEMIRDGDNGFMARDEDEWVARLEHLIDDVALRRFLGAQGRRDAVARWSLSAHAPRFVAAVRAAMEAA
jgi:glycosyltransferase involved in cell wall biosynthesis